MEDYQTQTPVAFFVFNRPDKTRTVLEEIASVEPETLLVIADGPRSGVPEDEEKCERVRKLIREHVDWECKIKRNYASSNMGLKDRFVSGLEWVFSEVERAIILEDDCHPNVHFFRFCDEMLEEYADDKRVMDVTGSNHLGTWKDDQQDYHFSQYGSIWGWATWRRSWELYDPEMRLWEKQEVRDRLRDVIGDKKQYQYLKSVYQQTYDGDIETWDYQWGFARHINSALSVVPARNLISNIGFGDEGTHTQTEESDLADKDRHELSFPINRAQCLMVDGDYDQRFHSMRPITHRNKFLRYIRRKAQAVGLD